MVAWICIFEYMGRIDECAILRGDQRKRIGLSNIGNCHSNQPNNINAAIVNFQFN